MRTSLVVLAVFAAACGVNDSTVGADDGVDQLADDAELSATSRTYVGIRRDFRKCVYPLCGGYWVHDLNRKHLKEVYVSGLDFTGSGLGEVEQGQLELGLGEVVLRGKLGPIEKQWNTRPFIVSEAYRGLPGRPFDGEDFVKVQAVNLQCIRAPCASLGAKRVNYTAQTLFHGLDLDRAAAWRVDTAWLTKRIVEDGAIVAGSWTFEGEEQLLDVANVFLRLPENTLSCPVYRLAACPTGHVRTYARDADRCLVPRACVAPGACTKELPVCDQGYSLQSWPSAPNACNAYACDPAWVVGED